MEFHVIIILLLYMAAVLFTSPSRQRILPGPELSSNQRTSHAISSLVFRHCDLLIIMRKRGLNIVLTGLATT
jgi:hypothetical protein